MAGKVTIEIEGRTFTGDITEVLAAPPPPPPPPPERKLLKLSLVFAAGAALTFDERDALDMGDYSDPAGRFVQRCLSMRLAPWQVFFRPDRDSERWEVVVELGSISKPAAHSGPYTATLTRGEEVLLVATVPEHFWWSRWRAYSAPRSTIGDVFALIQKGLLPPYLSAPKGAPKTLKPYKLMGMAAVEPGGPNTGERGDIGPQTSWAAEFFCTGATWAFEQMRDNAEASGTIPWNFRTDDGLLLDFDKYPGAQWYSADKNYGTPWMNRLNIPSIMSADGKTVVRPGIQPDLAHKPSLAYPMFLMTGDPYYLEQLQIECNYALGSGGSNSYRLFGPQWGIEQSRAGAWQLRDMACTAMVTPESVPSWLLPKSYFASRMDRYPPLFIKRYITPPQPECRSVQRSVWASVQAMDEYSPWQEDFYSFVAGWVVTMGFEKFRPIFEWVVDAAIARSCGTRGWPQERCTSYRIKARHMISPYIPAVPAVKDAAGNIITAAKPSQNAVYGPWYTSWKETWEGDPADPIAKPGNKYLLDTAKNADGSTNAYGVIVPGQFSPPGNGSYLLYLHGVLKMAKQLGVAGTEAGLAFTEKEIARLKFTPAGGYGFKWLF